MPFRTKPDMSAVWASLGDNTKPLDSYITNGWEAVRPPRQYFNWLDNRQDSAIAYIYQAGVVGWDSLTDYEGGAGVNSYVQGSDGKVYKCLADNGPNVSGVGTKDPIVQPGNAAFWVEAFGSKAASDTNAADIAALRADYKVGAAITDPAAWRTALSVPLASTVATHTTQIGNGSGVTDPSAWRTALSVPSTSQALQVTNFTGANQSLSTRGFQKFPGGFIVQWGRELTSGGWNTKIMFPTAFPSACVAVFPVTDTQAGAGASVSYNTHGVKQRDLDGFYGGGQTIGEYFTYIAIGY